MPKTWQQVQEVTKFLKGKKVGGQDAYGYLDPIKGWGGFGFYFLGSRATAYAKHPDDKAWLFDADTMKPRVNNPAWVRAIQDVIDALPSEPADQINADPGTTAFQQFLAGTGSMLSWWGDVGSNAKTNDSSVIGDVCGFSILPGSDDVYNSKTGAVGQAAERPELRAQHGLYRLGRLCHGARRQRRQEAEGGVERGRASRRQGHLAVVRGLSVGLPALSQQPLQHSGMGRRRLRRGLHHVVPEVRSRTPTTIRTRRSSRASPASSSTTAWPRTSSPRSSPAARTRRPGADNIAAAWEKITDQIGRDKQIALYKASLGI